MTQRRDDRARRDRWLRDWPVEHSEWPALVIEGVTDTLGRP